MKTISFLTLLLLLPLLAFAEQDALKYLYEPDLDERGQSMALRIAIHARNAEFDAASLLSQDLLDAAEPLRDRNPSTYGQVMVNHGILRVANREYALGLSIIERGMEFLETRTKPFDETLINAIMAKGIGQLQQGLLTDAEDTFRRAQHITHRNQGVHNEDQLPIVSYLTATNLRRRDTAGADTQQLFSLRVAEQAYGPDSIELLPTLNRLGSYFATRGSTIPLLGMSELRMQRDLLFRNSVNMYQRAVEIIEINYGVNDLRLLPTLRGLASARMLQITNRKHAETALLRSIEIVDANPNSDLTDRAQAMVDLGDLYIITSNDKAAESYLGAWNILQESPETRQLATALFNAPIRLYPRNTPVMYLERLPNSASPGDELYVDLQYDVSPDGRAQQIEILESNVPNEQVRLIRQTLRASRYRPRIEDGELVATESLQIHQSFGVLNPTPRSDDDEQGSVPAEEKPSSNATDEPGPDEEPFAEEATEA